VGSYATLSYLAFFVFPGITGMCHHAWIKNKNKKKWVFFFFAVLGIETFCIYLITLKDETNFE
jgi:hypothetical protein